MDYDDNESEGHNLHLAGEESSKNSSVLRPFSLPKFDFDDSLHSHLRFDSLAESEVFLGIPSQEDNNWIEDFSRGSSGLVFGSSAAESCALPSHINVWSEATSTESVELLLKAVGQEEMASGDNTIKESCPVVQPGSSIVEMDMDNMTVDRNMKDIHNGYGSTTPNDEIQGVSPISDQNVGVKDYTTGHISPTQEISISFPEVIADGKNNDSTEIGGKLNVEIKASSIDQVETGNLTDESLRNHVEENFPAPRMDIETTGSSSQKSSDCVGELVHRDNLGDSSLAVSGDVAVHIPDLVEDVEGSTQKDIETNKITVEADKFESHSPLEAPSQMEPSKEERIVETQEGESTIDGTNNEVMQDVGVLDDKSSISNEENEESCMGLGADANDVTPTSNNAEPKPDVVTKSSVHFNRDNVFPGSNSSFVDPPDVFADVPIKPPVADLGDKIIDRGTFGNSTDCTVAAESPGKNLVVRGVRDSEYSSGSASEKIEALIHSPSPLPAANMEICREDCHISEEDVCGREQADTACETKLSKSSLNQKEICDEQEKETEPNITGNTSEPNVETASGFQPNEFTNTFSVSNTMDDNAKWVAPALEGDESVHNSERPCSAPSFDTGDNNQSKENDADSLNDPSRKESLGPSGPAHDVGTEGISPLGSAELGRLERNDNSIALNEATSVDLPEESSKELSKKVELSGSVQDYGADDPFAEKLMDTTRESSGTMSATIPVTSCTDTIVHLSAPDVCSSSPSKSVMKIEVSLDKSITEKAGEVLSASSAVTASCQAEENFTFDVRPLGGQSTVDTVNDSPSLNAQRTFSTSGDNSLRDPELIKETSGSVSERKARRGGSRSGKGSVKRGNQAKKTPTKQNGRDETSVITLNPLGTGQLVPFDSAVKQRENPVFTTSNLPDPTSSAKSSVFFQQPFTDSQQVQLRAQIFVYGSLIQGVSPDEACMVSAFDGQRHVWEPAWRACIEKLRGGKGPEPANTPGFSSGTVRSSNKTTTSSVSNPAFSLSSPLWSIATPSIETLSTKVRGAPFDHQAVSPLHPFQSPSPIGNFTAHTTWPSQSPFPVPWIASSQSSPFGISTNYSTFPITESVRLTPVKDSSSAISSRTNLLQTTPQTLHTGATPMFSGACSLNPNKVNASSGQSSLDTKTRKRKKSSSNDVSAQGSVAASPVVSPSVPLLTSYSLSRSPAQGDGSRFSVIARNNVTLPSTPAFNSHYSTSVVAAPSPSVPKSMSGQLLSVGRTMVTHDIIKTVEQSKDRAEALNVDGFKKVEDAKLHAQEAASCSSEAIQHCESMWNQLKHQNYSGLSLTEDIEHKLASAAAAVAAAACVAKAASAAANVALSAAVQAKLLAEAAVTESGAINTVGQDVKMLSNTVYGTPSLEISSAREAARRRVEAASAATRHAENLDAIVKAAELAAEAVSHTGKIVAMGDPFSVRELVEAGPDNYWRVLNVADEPKSKNNIGKSNRAGIVGVGQQNLEGPEKDKVSDASNIASLAPELYVGSGVNSDVPAPQNITSIKEGSTVEVLKDRGDQKEGWFSANVVSLKNREAFVSYTEIQSDEGINQLKEWVSLESKDGEPPRVRIPHPMTSVQFEGTRKRRRSAVKDYSWSVGDRVDAWVQDCWREGVLVEKNAKDTTSLGVHFSAQGESLMVKLWHLRPTLVWTGEQWIEWCSSRKDGGSQGDTPLEKRPKLGGIDAKGKSTMSKSMNDGEAVPSEEARLPLFSKDEVFQFNIGGNGDDSKRTTVRTGRSVPDKGGSRVVFGVPKPGKKRKFMEVSKHYVSDRSTKVNEPDDSMKLARFLAPHGSGPRGLKNVSKVDKDRQVAGLKPKVPKFGKPPSIPGRTVARKDASGPSRENERDETTLHGSKSNYENRSGEEKIAELGSSNAEVTSGGDMVFSSKALPKENRKKLLTRGGRSERLDHGERFPTSGKVAKTEANEKVTSQAAGVRRSNRRIQPTSRLLEGLQSSLTVSKPSSSSHDKSQRPEPKHH